MPASRPLLTFSNRVTTSCQGACHCPAGLLGSNLSTGDYLVAGKDIIGSSWPDEELAERDA